MSECDFAPLDVVNGRLRYQCKRPECGRIIAPPKLRKDGRPPIANCPIGDALNSAPKERPHNGAGPATGPGTELASLIKLLGGREKPGCGCRALVDRMNRWGVDGCREHRVEIVAKLTASAAKWGIADWFKGALLAIYRCLEMRLNPRDPIGSLVDLAIERAATSPTSQPPQDQTVPTP